MFPCKNWERMNQKLNICFTHGVSDFEQCFLKVISVSGFTQNPSTKLSQIHKLHWDTPFACIACDELNVDFDESSSHVFCCSYSRLVGNALAVFFLFILFCFLFVFLFCFFNLEAEVNQQKQESTRGPVVSGYKYLGPLNGLGKGELVNRTDMVAKEHDRNVINSLTTVIINI